MILKVLDTTRKANEITLLQKCKSGTNPAGQENDLPLDLGCYGYKFKAGILVSCQNPGFVKKYIRRCKRIEKTNTRRQDRYEAKRQLTLHSAERV